MPVMRTFLLSRPFWLRAILGGFVAVNCIMFARRVMHDGATVLRPGYQDAVTASDEDFRRVLPHLPTHGRIGYLKPGFERANSDDLAQFFQAQYSLAPLVLVTGTQPEFVVAVAREDKGLPEIPDGFERVQVFSAELALYRRVR